MVGYRQLTPAGHYFRETGNSLYAHVDYTQHLDANRYWGENSIVAKPLITWGGKAPLGKDNAMPFMGEQVILQLNNENDSSGMRSLHPRTIRLKDRATKRLPNGPFTHGENLP